MLRRGFQASLMTAGQLVAFAKEVLRQEFAGPRCLEFAPVKAINAKAAIVAGRYGRRFGVIAAVNFQINSRRLGLIAAMLAFASIASPGDASACTSTTSTPQTMALQSPCSPNIVTHNQKTSQAVVNVAIADADMFVPGSSRFPVKVQAPGMFSVVVYMHDAVVQLINDGFGTFSGTLDLSHEYIGPLPLAIFAYDKAYGDPSYTVELGSRMFVWVNGSSWSPSWWQIPPQAAGMKIKFVDRFNNLNASPCKPGTGTWPHCTAPTASDGFTYFENKPNGGDYGAAAFEHTDSAAYNPFTIIPGFLRIRSMYDPNYVDPYGYSRHWHTGFLATAFPDGTTNFPMGNGYYEVRMLVPQANSGGTWPSFFMQTLNAMRTGCKSGDIEEDITEQYGNDNTYTQMGQHPYCGATGKDSLVYAGHPFDLARGFQRHGLLITDTTISYYLNDKLMASAPRDQLVGGVAPQWFLMLTMAMGGGWPVVVPPAGYYDMWVDYVRYLAP